MKYTDSKNDLIKEDVIKKCPIDFHAINKLVGRANIDIKTAERNLKDDEECAYNYAYNAMLRSGLALMFSEGYRPKIKGKHLTVIRFTSSVLGVKFKKVINSYDIMRRKRHRFIYEPDLPCSKKEAEESLIIAKNFVKIIQKSIKKRNPQEEFDF
ncbi:MAG: HEPN domain-containing protein [Candidatus Aureabacteria bacterium]|nr:HEPN domain-containing protein [Candidatus Auribacterota bacterium]